MEGLYSLVSDAVIPPMLKVRYDLEDIRIADIQQTVWDSFEKSGLASRLTQDMSIAVGVGSRGLCQLPEEVKAVIDWFKAQGTKPFIVPAMGSHGNATGEGQAILLGALGITPESMGCPVVSSMETVEVGRYEKYDLPVYMDKNAFLADGVFVINRVKLHTTFTAKNESGLVKMLTIGLGKQMGASSCHNLGYKYFAEVMPAMTSIILEKHPKVLGGLAVVENAYDHPYLLEVVPASRIIERDAELLELSKTLMPSLPVKSADVLIVDRIGKNISGLGADPNITGHFLSEYKSNDVSMYRLGFLDLTEETHGGASGIGGADAITQRLHQKIDYEATYANVITSTNIRAGNTPLVLSSDELLLKVLIKSSCAAGRPLRMIRIRDTLSLSRLMVSPALIQELEQDARCAIVSSPAPLLFDEQGNLTDMNSWWNF